MSKQLASDKLANFMHGFCAAVQLLKRAGRNGYVIEHICLATSVIDSLLRMGLILKEQLENENDRLIEDLLFQNEEDKIVSEREIYKRSKQEQILSEELFQSLNTLYTERNKVVHRYIISQITTDEVIKIGIEYEKIIPKLKEAVQMLEDLQISKGVGMTRSTKSIGSSPPIEVQVNELAGRKHGNVRLSRIFEKEAT